MKRNRILLSLVAALVLCSGAAYGLPYGLALAFEESSGNLTVQPGSPSPSVAVVMRW